MISSGQFSYSFRKSPLLRIILVALFAGAASFAVSLRTRQKPVIESINPPVASPGDVVVIIGKNFGEVRESGYVEFAGSRLTSSAYLSWTDSEIKVALPANVQDGLVYVGDGHTRSEPSFFANAQDIPVPVRTNLKSSLPVITSFSENDVQIGERFTIYGNNFGSAQGASAVYFTSRREGTAMLGVENENSIAANKNDFDYEFWSDTEIIVRVPDGATSGNLYVETPSGRSDTRHVTIGTRAGSKTFSNPRTYILQLSADIDDINATEQTTIRFYFPRPLVTSAQPSVEITECAPEPIIADYQNTIVQQLQVAEGIANAKRQFRQNFVVSVYEVRSNVRQAAVQSTADMNSLLLATATQADSLVPSNDSAVVDLAQQIVQNETNPYTKARLIYNYMLDNFRLNERRRERQALELLRSDSGDAYMFAVIYTALLRASDVPAFTCGGILVDRDLQAQNHWWCEFYISGVGWIPADVALGAGLSYKSWTEPENARDFYFGNMDAQHVVFSRGLNDIKPAAGHTKTVQYPRSYALQTVWEDSSVETTRYSSLWQNPVVAGVY